MVDVLIRVDASTKIGTGHVMRCLTIAEELRQRNCSISFYMKRLPGNLIDFVKKRGFSVINQFKKADICIIDHYDIDKKLEQSIRPYVKKIVVIDDLANRFHDCDLLIDQNIVVNYESRYDQLVPSNCKKLLGVQNLIIRNEFVQARKKAKVRSGEVNRLLIFMGGADPTNETMKVLRALSMSEIVFSHIDVVVGQSNLQKEKIERICFDEGYHFHCQINYLAELMRKADFSIGAGGSTTWERCYVGLPSSSTIVAENQVEATEEAERLGVVWNLGWHEDVMIQTYKTLLESLWAKKSQLNNMSKKGLDLTEKISSGQSVVDVILEGFV